MQSKLLYTSPAPESILAELAKLSEAHEYTYEEPLVQVAIPDGYMLQLALEVANLYPVGSATRNRLECLANIEDVAGIKHALVGTAIGRCLIRAEDPSPHHPLPMREHKLPSGTKVVRDDTGCVRFIFPSPPDQPPRELWLSASCWDTLVKAMEVEHATS